MSRSTRDLVCSGDVPPSHSPTGKLATVTDCRYKKSAAWVAQLHLDVEGGVVADRLEGGSHNLPAGFKQRIAVRWGSA